MAANTSRKIPLICSGHSRPVPDLSYSTITEDGFFLISACLDGKPMLRNGVTGDWLGTFLGHKGAVWSAHLNSNALQAATASADYTAKVWDALSGEELHTFTHGRIVKSVNFSKDDKRILTGAQDKLLRIFDLGSPQSEPQVLEGHTQAIKVALWGSENTILSGGQDNALRIWDARTLKEVKNQPFKANITNVDISLDGKHIVVSYGKEVAFLSADAFDVIKTVTLSVDINSACLSPDASQFIVGGTDFWARVYDFNTNKELEVLKGHHGPVHCVRYAPDGATFASGSEDGTIRLWQSGDPKNYGLWQETKDTKDQAPSHSDQQ